MRLLIREAPRTMVLGDGPIKYRISVGLRNGTSHALENCRLQVQIISHDGIRRPGWVRIPICEPFRLSPDDIHYVDVAQYDFDVLDAHLEVPNFHRVGNHWEDTKHSIILTSGCHEINVEALSDNSRIARTKLTFETIRDRWWVNGNTTGEE